jgi:hypothetical protein
MIPITTVLNVPTGSGGRLDGVKSRAERPKRTSATSRGGATVLKVGGQIISLAKNFFVLSPHFFGILGGQTYYFSIIGIVAKPNYIC